MIKIQNIYYMLAYAFSVLNEDGYKNIATEEFEEAADLFAALLAKGISNQIKKVIGKEYINKVDVLRSPTGKIDISSSIKYNTMLNGQLICEFDEYLENTYINQILKSTIILLLHSQDVTAKHKQALKRVLLYFSNVDVINVYRIRWSNINYHRNNAAYKMLINICYLIISGMLLSEQDGTQKLSKYIDDQKMHHLYERFILQYYRKHYPQFSVSAAQIDWNVDDGFNELLPIMQTDITIEYCDKTLIIDAKYYSHTMQTNKRYNNQTLHSSNLYQIFTYVKNRDASNSGNVSGVLLYAKTDEEITPNHNYLMSGNRISVRTLDLSADFTSIRNELDLLVKDFFNNLN